jgi:dihydroorotate dehydrogenase (NAD+) catalytic subunit
MTNPSLEIRIKNLSMRSPIMTASGTSGSSDEMNKLQKRDAILKSLGAFVTKGVTLKPRKGNPDYRVIETRTGLLNSIGLQNSGAKTFMRKELPRLLNFNLPIIVNISANSIDGFKRLASYLKNNDNNEIISGIEINVSCPNIKEGGVAFGAKPRLVERVVKTVKREVGESILVITKLTPNVTDITLPAKAAIEGGTDVLSMINTIRGMAINIENHEPFLGNVYGGLSGPAIKPVGIFSVYQCYRNISECRRKQVPIIGIGGISNWRDAIEYIIAGATAIAVGTAWFINPTVFVDIAKGIEEYCVKNNIGDITKIVGSLKMRRR